MPTYLLNRTLVLAGIAVVHGEVAGGQNTRAPEPPLEDAAARAGDGGNDWILRLETARDLAARRTPDAIVELKSFTAEGQPEWLRARALVALAEIAPDHQSAVDFAGSESATLRSAGIEALGIARDTLALSAIETALRDPDAEVCAKALAALARVDGERAWPEVEKALQARTPQTQIAAIQALSQLPGNAAREKLLALLDSKDRKLQIAALSSIADMRDPETLGALIEMIARERNNSVRNAAAAAFATFETGARRAALLARLGSEHEGVAVTAFDLLARNPDADTCRAVARTLPQLASAAPLAAALRLLGRCDADGYRDVLAAYVADPRAEVRLATVDAIGRGRREDRFALLQSLTSDPDLRVREAIFNAIRLARGWTPEGGLVAYLAPALQGTEPKTFRAAANLLRERITLPELPLAIQTLEKTLGGASDEARELAMTALSRAADPDSARAIARAQGYLVDWLVLGPTPETGPDLPAFPPAGARTRKPGSGETPSAAWTHFQVDRADGTVDLLGFMGTEPGIVHAAAEVRSPEARTVLLRASADCDFELWLNGLKIAGFSGRQAEQIEASLTAGPNRIMVRAVRSRTQMECWFRIRVVDATGTAIVLANAE